MDAGALADGHDLNSGQHWDVDRAFCHHPHVVDRYPHALYLAHLQTRHRDSAYDRHLCPILAALRCGFSSNPIGPGLGSPGRDDLTLHPQDW